MADWGSVLAAYWALWLIDGVKRAPAAAWRIVGARRIQSLNFQRLQTPGFAPSAWRATAEEIPFSLSPAGICNRPAGRMGRPGDGPPLAQAWRWEEIESADSHGGWLRLNGRRFCRDTGHLPATHLLELARLEPELRRQRIHWRLRRWLRPAHLRRRVVVLRRHTVAATAFANAGLVIAFLVTLYLVAQVPTHAPDTWNRAVAQQRPWLIGCVVVLHLAACIATLRAFRRLNPVSPQKRASALFSALLVPPHALRLRTLAGDGFFPVQHPAAYALALPPGEERTDLVRALLADLRWPIDDHHDGPLAREITRHYRNEWETLLREKLQERGLPIASLTAPPDADGPESALYCQRCRAQFHAGPTHCPKGIPLAATAPRRQAGAP